ncbi:MAG: hypothetical protein EB127_14095 [Alphaproteobacteria bacterium]|nr:hypothetical protein [Alphaproteobacteria bacterium]
MSKEDYIKYVTEHFPVTVEEFKKIQQEQFEMFCKKQFDYGPGNISLGSDLNKKEDRFASISAVVVRLNDKIQRLINLVLRKQTLQGAANEPVMDAFRDAAVYCIIAEIVYNHKWAK